ncbi:hypothetical protein AB4455_18025 [Vibrio sp. 10N.261.46.E12]|uniref:hypothetical protein n=1 Tax=unclassified Vibrio TaxID=2614977 RepID=UPI0009762F99|nr:MULTISPECIES: hypothetical protein [unclassified Vibrio]OMO34144.1 hypothetical protein BH584_13820 [Vibrio sp. 10N.261.45.E1]PMJ21120.1 hypothetical protein BCU27_19060 [Vibrio sp. 10N.286.45.B6]PML84052.1 hypothetical protein BCT66_18100 [Vibrio sp. 10N.261.49.E11]PMM67655.1 hypothetical protein BCT48_14135 [Vibrio sp. 10N.261.46.F12]PMM86513.1 hypothetical protein BCT46_08075 [Vibrio sp. 10N.261.46.E8]
MLNKKPLLGLAAISIFATTIAHAKPPGHEDDKTGDVVFSASVESQCGIEATEDKANLAFGDSYNESHATVKLVSNRDGVKVRAEDIKIESFDGQIQKSDVFFQSTGTTELDQSALGWESGVDITRDQIRADNNMNLFARVAVDESNLDANEDYEVKTTWTVECN